MELLTCKGVQSYTQCFVFTESIAAMSKRINVMIDEDTWKVLGKMPSGERSRAVNQALRSWVTKGRRSDAVREMDALRMQLPKVSSTEVIRWIHEDRGAQPLEFVSLGVPEASVLLKCILPS